MGSGAGGIVDVRAVTILMGGGSVSAMEGLKLVWWVA